MKRASAALLVAAVSGPAFPAAAQTAGDFMSNPRFQGPPPTRCVSTLEMQHCAADELRRADAEMSARYAALRDRLQPTARKTLLAEQRNWLGTRDKACLAGGKGGGSMASLNIAGCWLRVTKVRSAELMRRRTLTASERRLPAPSAFIGRWYGGEGTYMTITRRGSEYVIDNRWGLDADMQSIFSGTLTAGGLVYRRGGKARMLRPAVGDAVNRSALRGKKDCLMVSNEEGYCRY